VTDATSTATAPQPGPPDAAGFISDRAYGELPADQQALYSRTPGNEVNGSRWQLRSEFEKQSGEKTGTDPATSTTDDAIDPAEMAAGETIKIVGKDGKDFELTADDIAALMTQRAENDLRRANMPVDANGYEAKLPDSQDR